METSEVSKLQSGCLVWVWIVRFGNGRWWPGTVLKVENGYGTPVIKVRYESLSRSRHHLDPPVTLGYVTAPMRRLERRNLKAKGSDRPRFVPTSRLRRPELPALANGSYAIEEDTVAELANISVNHALDAAALFGTEEPHALQAEPKPNGIGHPRESHRREESKTRSQFDTPDGGTSGTNLASRNKSNPLAAASAKKI